MTWDLLKYFPHEIVKVDHFRFADGAIDAQGKYTPGAETKTEDFEIVAPQPITGDDLKMLPQGEEASDYLFSMSRNEILVRKNKKDSDEIEWDGLRYKVVRVNSRITGGFYSFTMVRKKAQV